MFPSTPTVTLHLVGGKTITAPGYEYTNAGIPSGDWVLWGGPLAGWYAVPHYRITGIDKEEASLTCTGCAQEIDPLAVFPGGICVECYAKTPEANAPITAEELAVMWGAKPQRGASKS